MTKQPFQQSMDELLTRAIRDGSSACRHEIMRRQAQTNQTMSAFLLTELARVTPHDRSPEEEREPEHQSDDLIDTLKQVRGVVEGVDIDESDAPDPICRLAREMLAFEPPFLGLAMNKAEQAESYIYSAADNPKVASQLPASGLAFWRAAAHQFRAHRARHRRGVTAASSGA